MAILPNGNFNLFALSDDNFTTVVVDEKLDKNFVIRKLQHLTVLINSKKYDLPEVKKSRACYDSGYKEGYERCARQCRDMVIELLEELKRKE